MDELLTGSGRYISLTGGGGKTTFLIAYASYLKAQGKKVLLTTSTKLGIERDYGVDSFFSDDSILAHNPERGETVLFAIPDQSQGRYTAPPEELVGKASGLYDVVLVEADGSRGRPFKIHSSRDPVVWSGTTAVVSVLGLWGLYGGKAQMVFGEDGEGEADLDFLSSFLDNPEGPFKGMGKETRNVLLLNVGRPLNEEERRVFLPYRERCAIVVADERTGVVHEVL